MEGIGGNPENPDENNFNIPGDFPESFKDGEGDNGPFEHRKMDFEEILETTNSISSRYTTEIKKRQRFIEGGTESDPVEEAVINLHTTTDKTMLLQRLANPDAVIDYKQLLDENVTYLKSSILEKGSDLTEDEAEVTAEDIIDELKGDLPDSSDQKSTEEFKREIVEATKLADSEGVTVAEVYDDPEKHQRLQQALFTPDDIAARAFNEGNVSYLEIIDGDPDEVVAKWEFVKLQAVYDIVDTWGPEGIENLSDDVKMSLGVDEGAVSPKLVEGAPQFEDPTQQEAAGILRTAFAKSYFVDKNWDYENPQDYHLESLREHPTWVNPFKPGEPVEGGVQESEELINNDQVEDLPSEQPNEQDTAASPIESADYGDQSFVMVGDGAAHKLRETSQEIPAREPLGGDELLIRANAIEARTKKDMRAALALNHYNGDPEVAPEIQNIIDSTMISYKMRLVENPEKIFTRKEIFESVDEVAMSRDIINSFAEAHNRSYIEAADIVWHSVRPPLKRLMDSMLDVTTQGPDSVFAKEYRAVEKVAQDLGVSFADVYKDDKLYVKALRESADNNPDNFVQRKFGRSAEIVDKSTRTIAMQDGLPAGSPRIRELHDELTRKDQTINVANFVKVWNADGIDKLSAESKRILGVENGAVIPRLSRGDVADATEKDRANAAVIRTAFAKQYFGERGWDINSPTTAQIKQLRLQPIWKDPLRLIK